MRDDGQLPECTDECTEDCDECPYFSEEYQELTDVDPLYLAAQNYLVEHELGLAPPRSALEPRLIEAIKFVHSASFREHERVRRQKEAARTRAQELQQIYGRK
jgi:hypothetical protein